MKDLSSLFPDLPSDIDISLLDTSRIPTHIAVIMDGNGRWAKERLLNRLRGHKAGIEAVRETIRCASDLGVKYLTIYSFSTENWSRPEDEVSGLMELFAKTMLAEVDELAREGVRVKTIGDISMLPDDTRLAFKDAACKTAENTGLTLVVAINYGARDEIVRAAKILADSKIDAADITPELLEENLYTSFMPDPELIIRTSGEMRLSNFLLWQAAYSEFVATPVLWPDFDRYEFLRCLLEYLGRERRFGGISS